MSSYSSKNDGAVIEDGSAPSKIELAMLDGSAMESNEGNVGENDAVDETSVFELDRVRCRENDADEGGDGIPRPLASSPHDGISGEKNGKEIECEWWHIPPINLDTSSATGVVNYGVSWLRVNQGQFLAGLTVALILVPEAVAFSFLAGVDPYVGLTAAWIVGLTTSIAGGRPGQISGATGAMAVIMPDLVEKQGVGGLFYTIMLTGIIQLSLGALKANRTVRMISHPVMIGFCNGLALVIGLAQLHSFKEPESETSSRRQLLEVGSSWSAFTDDKSWEDGETVGWMLFLVFVTMAICFVMPRFSKRIPGPLVAVFFCTALEHGFIRATDIGRTNTVEDVASVAGDFPIPIWADSDQQLPTLTFSFFMEILPTSIILALIGLIESLMTLELLGEMTQTRGNSRRECVGQGLANIIAGMFGSMGGCATMGQSIINVKFGGVKRLSGIVAALTLLIIILAAYPLINLIPVGSLVGVMFMICYHTFEWDSIGVLYSAFQPKQMREVDEDSHVMVRLLAGGEKKIVRMDAVVIVVVTVMALVLDLATAVILGVVVSSLSFAWNQSFALEVNTTVLKRSVMEIKKMKSHGHGTEDAKAKDENDDDVAESGGVVTKIYSISGPVFFSSVEQFKSIFDIGADPSHVEVHLHNAQICDFSGLEAINSIAERYHNQGKTLILRHLSEKSAKLMAKAKRLVTENVVLTVSGAARPMPAHHLHIESRWA
eukprot:g3172.t1